MTSTALTLSVPRARAAIDAGDARGEAAHQRRRGVGGATAGCVGSGGGNRDLAKLDRMPRLELSPGRHGPICLGDRADVARRHIQRLSQRGIDPLRGRPQLIVGDSQLLGGGAEALLERDHCRVAAAGDRLDQLPDLLGKPALRRLQSPQLGGQGARLPPLEVRDLHEVASFSLPTSSSTSSARSLCETRLAISRAVLVAICSRTSSPFSFRVRPLATRSTMPSASPTSGASSTEPLTSITSAWRPVCSK